MRSANHDIDLGLSVLCVVSPRGHTLTAKAIAEVCGCRASYIYNVERQAIQKLKASLNRDDFFG